MSPDPVLSVSPPDFSRAGQIVRSALGGGSSGSGGEIAPAFFDLVMDLKTTKGLAGTDAYAHEWNNQFYRPALIGDTGGAGKGGGLMDAATVALNAMGMLSDLLVYSGINHALGDDPDAPAFPPGTHEVIPVPFVPDAQGRTMQAAPGWWPIIAGMLTGQEYPDGDVSALRNLRDRYKSTATAFRSGTAALDQASALVQQQQAPEVAGVVNWLGIVKTQLLDVADGFDVLGDGCAQFAQHVQSARDEVNKKAQEELGNIAETEIISAGLAGATLGVSEVLGNYRLYKRAKELAEFVKTRLSAERIAQELRDAFSPMAAIAGGPAAQGVGKLLPLLNAMPAIYMPEGAAEAAAIGSALGLDRLVTHMTRRMRPNAATERQVYENAVSESMNGKEYWQSGANKNILIPKDGKYPPEITNLPKTDNGKYYQGADGTLYPVNTQIHIGHIKYSEWARLRNDAIAKGWTERQLQEYIQNHKLYQIEDAYGNLSHQYEAPIPSVAEILRENPQ
ncbi:hypothetical protein Srot_0310 [Segniliparus rotundus DSM 44985]|uniref:Uncharacterized protein n=1 Tax=Segniliparus rotundus (strain ATCC BAA-972 / CDC 1076 / CIP 108378 / DSM 44985 / JCM 13578) TaxID=640132 RepID=D6ZB38_SEGRD|nr:HNH/ENDO VII family nuclease [Segniliparus rotundus]ADG96797.1 hypothetical protein Srot_0310 [Segniliparus rotundus DSM 44985]